MTTNCNLLCTMSADEQVLTWKIDNVREAISLDWKHLATKILTAD